MGKLLPLVALCFLHLCAFSHPDSQEEPIISLRVKNMTLKNVFDSITAKTSYTFFYGNAVLNDKEKISVDLSNVPLSALLNEVLKNRNIRWVITPDKYIQIKKSIETPARSSSQMQPVKPSADTLITVTGKVVNEEGEPVPAATVLVKGSKIGSTTSSEGLFTIAGVSPNASLVITNVSFLTQELPIKGRNYVGSISLKEYVGELDETVIIAYGTTTKRYNTGNVSTVKAEEIEKQPVNNPLLALQGRTPGVEITQATGIPGSGVKVRIRGQNSINKGNDPLYIIDGVPYVSQLLPGLTDIRGSSGILGFQGNPLSFINSNDIESIDVLKDADATAIYGSRAANGAVLITTKKGRAGETKVVLNAYTGWGNVTRKLDFLNTQQYLEIRRESFKNDNIVPDPNSNYDLFNNYTWDTTRYTDWQKELIGGTARYDNVDISVSGGNSNTQFLVGARYWKETTVFPGSFYDRKSSIHFSLNNVSSNKKFSLSLNGNLLVDDNHLLRTDLTNFITLAPNAPPLYTDEGEYNWAQKNSGPSTWPSGVHPLAGNIERKFETKTFNLVSSGSLGYKILPNLEIRSTLGYTNMQTDEHAITPKTSFRPGSTSLRRADFANNSIISWIIEPQINYNVNIGDGKITVLAGGTIQQNTSNGETYYGTGFNSDASLKDIKSASFIEITNTTQTEYEYSALFGKVNYNLQDKYLINLVARRDGSSRFGPESKFHNFGAVGAAWIFSKEDFIRSVNPVISFGKIRASYGTTGNDQISDYSYMDLYYSSVFNYQGSRTLTISNLYNPLLQWEETKKMEGGIELGFFQDKVLLSASYFSNKSGNQLASYSLPSTTGFSVITTNQDAIVRNSGWEFLLNTSNILKGNFKWSSSFNLTATRNKLLALGDGAAGIDLRTVGKPLNTIFLYKFLGVNSETGQYQFADQDGKATTMPDYLTAANVEVSVFPKYFGGFQNSFSFKGFTLDILFQFVKQVGENNIFGRFPGSNSMLNQPLSILNRWQKLGDITNIQKITQDPPFSASYGFVRGSDAAYTDASFIRLKNVSLLYELPKFIQTKISASSFQIYVQCQNLLTITKYKGSDPESRSLTSLPPLRVITTGIRVSL